MYVGIVRSLVLGVAVFVGCGSSGSSDAFDVQPGSYITTTGVAFTLVVSRTADGIAIDSHGEIDADTSDIPGAHGTYETTSFTAGPSPCEAGPNMMCLYQELHVEVTATDADTIEITTCNDLAHGQCEGPQVTCTIDEAKAAFPQECPGTTITARRQ